MIKNKLLLILLVTLFFSGISKAQDSLQFQKRLFKVQQQSTLVLNGWSVLNLGISSLCTKNLFNPVTSSDYFHSGNFNWNQINIGIAAIGYYSLYRSSKKEWTIPELKLRKKKLERGLIFNIALDVIYIASGVLLKYAINPSDTINYPASQGGGTSLILQGGFLLIFDSIYLKRLKRIKY
tara:strand:- start:3607 stop:4146 length:540 start_codon:yes stop_codon:yes gene_type:complete